MNNIEKRLNRIADQIYEDSCSKEWKDEIEIDEILVENNTILASIKTLTACSEPEINYYEDGFESIENFIDHINNKFTVTVVFEEDFTVTGNEYDEWVVRDGWLKISQP